MVELDTSDVIVVGGGNAGLCAALTARQAGARVTVLEKAPLSKKGGNSVFTGGRMRIPHGDMADLMDLIGREASEYPNVEVAPYTKDDFLADFLRQSRNQCDETLARVIAEEARAGVAWLISIGAKFELALGEDDVQTAGVTKFMGGDDIRHYEAGPGLVENLLRQCEAAGITVLYEAAAERLITDSTGVTGVVVRHGFERREMRAGAVILACGGFEANPVMRAAHLGRGWDLARVRGTEYNTGDGLRMAMDIGAQPYGHWSGCHSVACDYMAPEFGDRLRGDVAERVSYRAGITVNRAGERYFDEGSDLRAYTYAVSGANVIQLAEGYAVQIVDAKGEPFLRSNYRADNVTKVVSDRLETIAEELDIDAARLMRTVQTYNAAAVADVDFSRKDGSSTRGVFPPKSNWAARIDTPPFTGYPVTAGITFTFGGLRTSPHGEVESGPGIKIPGLFAAGEMVGGIYVHNYAGGSGLVSGLVMGRRAGTKSAAYASSVRA